MALKVNPGYTGYAIIGGVKTRFESADITAKQEINAPDLIMGHWDHNAYVFGPIEIGGSISGPVTENFVAGTSNIWDWGTNRGTTNTCGILETKDVELYYFCDGAAVDYGISGRKFGDMSVNSLNFSASAGDLAQFSIDVMGATAPTQEQASYENYTDAEKIVTWDEVGVTITGGTGAADLSDPNIIFSSFEFTINNNLQAVYAIGSNMDYYPYEIVPGLRTISGSLTAYNVPETNGVNAYNDPAWAAEDWGILEFTIAGETYSFQAQFHRMAPSSSTGPIMTTVGFTAVGQQTGLDV